MEERLVSSQGRGKQLHLRIEEGKEIQNSSVIRSRREHMSGAQIQNAAVFYESNVLAGVDSCSYEKGRGAPEYTRLVAEQ